jgi:hypothetical protein
MEFVAQRARRFENELVIEETSGLAVQDRDDRQQMRIASDAFAGGAQVDHRVEAVEEAFARICVILPAAANVVGVDEIGAL